MLLTEYLNAVLTLALANVVTKVTLLNKLLILGCLIFYSEYMIIILRNILTKAKLRNPLKSIISLGTKDDRCITPSFLILKTYIYFKEHSEVSH